MKQRRNKPREQLAQEVETLRQRLSIKDDQLDTLREQANQSWRQLGNLSGLSAADVKARLLEEAERARAEAEEHAAELDRARQRLKMAYLALEQRNAQLATAAEVAREAAGILDVEKLLETAVQLISSRFGFYHAAVYLLDDAGKYAELHAASSEGGQQLIAQGYKLLVGVQGIVGRVAQTGEPSFYAPEQSGPVNAEASPIPIPRSQTALPLKAHGRIIGVLDVHSTEASAFTPEEVAILQILADQIAVALHNAWLFQETDEARAAAKEALGAAQAAQRAAETANQAKSAFLANMSHELRTPLNAILGFTQLMARDAGLTPDQRENLDTISRSGAHLLTLINDVLEMSKIEAGRTAVVERDFDLYQLLDDLETMFRLRALDKGLALDFARAADVPRYIRSDENKLRQILINLLGNAVKFTETGRLTLRVLMQQDEGEGGRQGEGETISLSPPPPLSPSIFLCFEVADTGPGIPPEDLERIFNPFDQGQRGRQFMEGTGLGLPISRQFARLLGGDLAVTSAVGQGSCFRFSVQVQPADEAQVQAQARPREVIGLLPGQLAPDGGPFRLLVVEDRDANRRLLVKLLTMFGPPPAGFDVREAVNGAEALTIWEEWHPHLIWMDMRMPVLDGYEATRRIKATPEGQQTVIIALTASAFEEDRVEMLAEGCDDFVRKPFQSAEIFDKLAHHLGVRYRYAETAVVALSTASADMTAAALRALPPALLSRLERATVETDMQRVAALISEIRTHDPALADVLSALANDFEYDKILQAIHHPIP